MPPLYPTPPGDGAEPIAAIVKDTRRQLRGATRPDGTRLASLVAQVQAALANLTATVISTANAYFSAGTVLVANLTASGQLVSTAALKSPGSRAFTVTTGFAGAWLDTNGVLGINPSGVEFKQDFEPADLTEIVDAVLHTALIRYRMIKEVEELGDAATWHLGTIAQYMAIGPLAEWVVTTEAGAVINWEQFGIPLMATMQSIDARLKKLEEPEPPTA